ncbi:CaiB/BaiF CoA transferase family protein [Orrella sp. 11846]|uniref:CaiB/BaiF CoA transferase family protein n=1 Tax=Orrella sp. 11846 TaxID=3409913 RepID=UPI003B59085D
MKFSPLEGIKVVDLTKVLAGPICSQFLGDLGAEIIKVEAMNGDDTRHWIPKTDDQSTFFLAVNFNKKSIVIDLKRSEGLSVLHDLISQCDVVLQGFKKATAEKLKITYDDILKINPNVIYCEISGYGRQGPLGDHPGYDVMLQAFSGMLSTMGVEEGEYARASFSPVDIGTGQNALSGVLAAVIERQKTGKSVYVEASLLDTALTYMGYLAQSYWATDKDPKPWGTAHPSMCPYQAFKTADGMMVLGAGNDSQWKKFCQVADLEHLLSDPDLLSNDLRVKNMVKTVSLVQARLVEKSTAYWLEALEAQAVPCGPIHHLSQALAHPQVLARDSVTQIMHPTLGMLNKVSFPIHFDGADRKPRRSPPLLGEHTAEILKEIGYSDEKIDLLEQKGVVHRYG